MDPKVRERLARLAVAYLQLPSGSPGVDWRIESLEVYYLRLKVRSQMRCTGAIENLLVHARGDLEALLREYDELRRELEWLRAECMRDERAER